MKYLYGPIKSRRLGYSLGINLTTPKTCTFGCIYCQIGETSELTTLRSEYIKISDIVEELKEWKNSLKGVIPPLDYITLSGSGEPTLNNKISELIAFLKAFLPIRIAPDN